MALLENKHTAGSDDSIASVSFDAIDVAQTMIEELTVLASYDSDPTGGKVSIEDGDGTKYAEHFVTSKGPAPFVFRVSRGNLSTKTLVVKLTAGGSGVKGNISVHRKVYL